MIYENIAASKVMKLTASSRQTDQIWASDMLSGSTGSIPTVELYHVNPVNAQLHKYKNAPYFWLTQQNISIRPVNKKSSYFYTKYYEFLKQSISF